MDEQIVVLTHGTTPPFIEQEIIALMLLMLMERLVEETAIMDLPKDKRPCDDHVRPLRHNRAALGDRLPALIGLALRTRVPRTKRQEFSRGIAALRRCRTRVCRPRQYPRVCKSQYGRWRFDRTGKTERQREVMPVSQGAKSTHCLAAPKLLR